MTTQLGLPPIRSRVLQILSVTAAAWGVATWSVHAEAGRAGAPAQGPAQLRIGYRKSAANRPAAGRRRQAVRHDGWPGAPAHGLRWAI